MNLRAHLEHRTTTKKQRARNYSWFAERGRAGGDAFVCADPAVRHAADFERRLRRRSTQYR